MTEAPRFVALDIHKSYAMVGALDAAHQVVLSPRRVSMQELASWAQRHLRPTDQVVIEATINTWATYDLLVPLVARVVVANTFQVKQIAAAAVKTDTRDVLVLARLLAANLIPEVWVPPRHVRELRSVLVHRHRLVQERTAAKNRLHGLVQRYNLVAPAGELWSREQRAWWDAQELPALERLRVRQDLERIGQLSAHIAEVEAELARLSVQEPWGELAPYLLQLPGVGLVTAMTVLAAVGDISRFSTPKKLVGYSGLGARVRASGGKSQTGGITKQGRRELRSVLVEAAHAAIQTSPHWRQQCERLAARVGRPKAITAMARKLLVVIWHVLTKRTADRHADAPAVARKFLRWGTNYGLASRQGLHRAAFVRQQLNTVGVGTELAEVTYGQLRYDLMNPPPAPRPRQRRRSETVPGG